MVEGGRLKFKSINLNIILDEPYSYYVGVITEALVKDEDRSFSTYEAEKFIVDLLELLRDDISCRIKSAVEGLKDEVIRLKDIVYSEKDFTDNFPDDIQQAYLDCYDLFLRLVDKYFKDVI